MADSNPYLKFSSPYVIVFFGIIAVEHKFSSDPFSSIVNQALVDIAIKLQLSQSDHDLAVARYQTISDWLDRPDSPLQNLVELMYPQGGMAIGATIASRLFDDEFDIDVVAQLSLPASTSPSEALDILYSSIRGERGSRYFDKTERNSRCITVHYTNMHLDVTPAVLMSGRSPRVSTIFHSKIEEPRYRDYRLLANPYGFAEWYMSNVSTSSTFAEAYSKRSLTADGYVRSRADTEPVPDPYYLRSISTVALQLIKRWRNVVYDQRPGRKPPSVVLAKLVADSSSESTELLTELMFQVSKLRSIFEEHCNSNNRVVVVNPSCEEDVLTDRWPTSTHEQRQFAHDLAELQTALRTLINGVDLAEMKRMLVNLFGESPTNSVFEHINERIGRDIRQNVPRSTSPIPTILGSNASAATTIKRRPHTFYGSE